MVTRWSTSFARAALFTVVEDEGSPDLVDRGGIVEPHGEVARLRWDAERRVCVEGVCRVGGVVDDLADDLGEQDQAG